MMFVGESRKLSPTLLAHLISTTAILCIPGVAWAAGQDAAKTTAGTLAATASIPCPSTDPEDDAALAAIEDRMLKPGTRFEIDGIAPASLARLANMQKSAIAAQATDWANLCHYAARNAEVLRDGRRPDVVFIGDSITEIWQRADPGLFDAKVLDRGISGQTTPQILLRLYPDAVALRPRVIHIIAGSNDVFGNTGPTSDATIVQNLRAMIDIARANGIQVVLGAIPPSRGFVAKPGINPAARIIGLNAMLRDLAAEKKVVFADYHAALRDASGGMAAAYTNDDLHPNQTGFAKMRTVADRAIAQAMRGSVAD